MTKDIQEWLYPYASFFCKYVGKYVKVMYHYHNRALSSIDLMNTLMEGGGLIYPRESADKIYDMLGHRCLYCGDELSADAESTHNHMLSHWESLISQGVIRFDAEDICLNCGSPMMPMLDSETVLSDDSLVKYRCIDCDAEKRVNWLVFGEVYMLR